MGYEYERQYKLSILIFTPLASRIPIHVNKTTQLSLIKSLKEKLQATNLKKLQTARLI